MGVFSRPMKPSLRTKLMGVIVLAGTLLLLAALGVIWTMGYRQRLAAQGDKFQGEAAHVAHGIGVVIEQSVHNLQALLVAGDIANLAQSTAVLPEPASVIEARWAELSGDSVDLEVILQNALAEKLRAFRGFNPLLGEILVADAQGRLLAATGKTSDYDQADESWWQQAMNLRPGEAVLEGLAVDRSANIFSFDISLPLFARNGERPVGVLKAVVNASPLFASVPVFAADSGAVGEVTRSDGKILLKLKDSKFQPSEGAVPLDMSRLKYADRPGWFVSDNNGDVGRMIGYAPVSILGIYTSEGQITGDPFFVFVSQPASVVLAPLKQRTVALMLVGAMVIIVSAGLGILFAQRNIMEPIETLRWASSALVHSVEKGGGTATIEKALDEVALIRTDDEMEDLANDFSVMAAKLLRYQEELKSEIRAKTLEIQRDLEMAREFQQAFLPRDYPLIPSKGHNDNLTLNFHHVYQAAMSVSGDFFDVVKLDDHRAGVLVADVMGHGTRSALVTAILRTLLHGLAKAADDPALFLKHLNRHFYETMRQADQLVFVSACFVIFDTRKAVVRCASAGHPSPLLGNRHTGVVEELFGALRGNPALGLLSESDYSIFERPLREDDLMVLYTDGVVEALNRKDEFYGKERLMSAMRRNLRRDLGTFTQLVLEDVQGFTEYQTLTDDLCLVSVEIVPNLRDSLRSPSQGAGEPLPPSEL